MAARHSEEDIFQWVEERISKYQEANPTAIDVSGECPPFVQWKNLKRGMTKKFGCISEELDSTLRNRVFYRLLEWACPAYYVRTDPKFLKLDRYLLQLRNEFDEEYKTSIPKYDESLRVIPVPEDEDSHRAERRAINISNRGIWDTICDHIESRIQGGCMPVAWRVRPGFLQDLECEFGSFDPVLAEYAVDFCIETAVRQNCRPDPGPKRQRTQTGKRSRAKTYHALVGKRSCSRAR